MILVFKEFLQTSIRPLISVLYAKGYHDFPFKKLLSHSAEKIRRGTPLCFRKFLVPKNVKDKRGGGYHDFLSRLFCLTVPKNFVGEPFCVSKNFWCRKKLWIRRWEEEEGSITIFCRKIFVSQCRKLSYGNLSVLCFRNFPVAKKFIDETEGEVSRFSFKNYSPVAKKYVGEPSCV